MGTEFTWPTLHPELRHRVAFLHPLLPSTRFRGIESTQSTGWDDADSHYRRKDLRRSFKACRRGKLPGSTPDGAVTLDGPEKRAVQSHVMRFVGVKQHDVYFNVRLEAGGSLDSS
ncbi:hypothetical protein ACU8KH_02160 [Lachancea thermotolerans]